ncbi:MAG: hypothetical protein AB7O97_03000 [Planctomycetota bacterium]
MQRFLLACSTAFCLNVGATAQLLIAPEGSFATQPSSSVLTWRTTAFRFQMIYDTTHFTNQGVVGPISIDRMRFRAANGNSAAGGTYLGDGATFGVNISIGTSLTDYLTPSTTFASNRGAMQTVMQNGTVVCAAGAGTTPNDYVIDIVIPGGFVYDPTLGADLLIEVDAPTPSPTTIPTMATGVSAATNRSNRISNTTQAALTGTLSGFASVVLFDISGGPGGIPSIVIGSNTAYGAGCYGSDSRSFAEVFPTADPALDLGAGITLSPDVPGAPTRYLVSPGAGAFVPPGGGAIQLLSNAATPAALTDDTTTQPINLTSFSFPHVGGSTSVMHGGTNGYIVLQSVTGTGNDFSPTLTDLVGLTTGTHNGLPRLCPVWYDFHAGRNTTLNPAAGMWFEEDTVNQTATITWLDVGELATATAGAKSFNFQVHIDAFGNIEYRYGAMSTYGSTTQPKLVGYCPGAPTELPSSQDFSAEMPFLSNAVEVARIPLSLAASPAPILGGSVTVTTNDVPVNPGVMINVFSFNQILAGFDLAVVGMGGCNAYVDPGAVFQSTFLLGSGSIGFGINVPNDPFLAGFTFYSQTLAFDAAAPNSFGAVASNGVALTIGTVQ